MFFSFWNGVFNKKPCYLDKQQGVHEKTNKKVRQATGDKNHYKYNHNKLISSQNNLHTRWLVLTIKSIHMRKFVGFLLCTVALAQPIFAQVPEPVRLPNGWSLSPYGRNFPLGDLPLNIALSASGKKMAVTNNGQSQHSIQLIDPASEQVLHTLVVPKAWYGLAFTEDEKFLYVSGGHDNRINKYDVAENKLVLTDSILLGKPWPNRVGPSGIAVDSRNKKLFVATREDSALYTIDLVSNKVISQVSIGAEGYGCLLSRDRKFVYVSVWGGDRLLKIDANTGQITTSTVVGDNPNEIILSKKGDRIFVANANDNSVSVISTATMKVTETLNAALYPDAPSGSASNGLALSADEKRLYIANADTIAWPFLMLKSLAKAAPWALSL